MASKRENAAAKPIAERSPVTHGCIVDQAAVHRRAYELYEARGRADGAALDDWLQAEQEIAVSDATT